MTRTYTLYGISCIILVLAYCITAPAVEVSIPSLTADAGSSITVPVNVDDAKGISGGDITVTFDQTILTAKEAKATELTKSLNFMPNIMAGEVTVSMAGVKGIAEGRGAIVEIAFEVSATAKGGTSTPLTFKEAALYDELGGDIPVDMVNGSVTINAEEPPITDGRKLIIPELTAKPGDTITVPINVTDATGIAGADIVVTYDQSMLTVKPDEIKATTLSSGINLVVNAETAGEITLSMAGTKGIAEGSGAIVEIVFAVSATAKDGDKSPLTFTDAALYDELGNDIPVQTEDGILTIEAGTQPQEFPRWDVNEDGVVNIADLVLVGLHFGEDYRQNAPISPLVGKMRSKYAEGDLWLEAKTQIDSGEYLHVQLKTTPITDLYGYQFILGFDPTALEVLTAMGSPQLKQDGEQTSWTVSEKRAFVTATHVRQATKRGINANGTLATIIFRVKNTENSKNSPLNLTNIELADSKAQLIPVNIKHSNLNLRRLFTPSSSLLAQNYPNPFNPETWIPYQLASDANVTINIYNAKGQFVRMLYLDNQKAGIYLTRTRAAYWDGKDNLGQRVASGVYFYTMHAGDFMATRKMVIAK